MKADTLPTHRDVLIVGAGLSGIGAACYLGRECPHLNFALLESRDSSGGTWDLFRYPGIRSDSDMFTLGYAFKPWTNTKSLADGDSILHYIRETASEHDVERRIHYQCKVITANWSSEAQEWTVSVQRGDGQCVDITCNFLYMCSGYYDYDRGYTPHFEREDDFCGELFHAQHWPEKLDYSGKRAVVIGSGATAVTLVPELAKQTEHTVMLQRSPTYIASVPSQDGMAIWMRNWLPARWAYHVTRWKKILLQQFVYNLSRRRPQKFKDFLLKRVRDELGPAYDVETHFTPDYNPWDQRLCAVPDSDMFEAIRDQRAEVVTDRIEHFTADGIQLASGKHLDADIVVLATGLNMLFMGGIALAVDGEPVDPAQRFLYRGMMLSGVPNLAQAFGYTNASWTLKADLTAEYVCRLLNHMRETGSRTVMPDMPAEGVEEEPMMDFTSGYVVRAMDSFPRQGKEKPWCLYQNYFKDMFSLRHSSLKDDILKFQ